MRENLSTENFLHITKVKFLRKVKVIVTHIYTSDLFGPIPHLFDFHGVNHSIHFNGRGVIPSVPAADKNLPR